MQLFKVFFIDQQLDQMLQNMEACRSTKLKDVQIEQIDVVAMEFFQHQRTLTAQLKNLQMIEEKRGQIDEILNHAELLIQEIDQVTMVLCSLHSISTTTIVHLIHFWCMKLPIGSLHVFVHYCYRTLSPHLTAPLATLSLKSSLLFQNPFEKIEEAVNKAVSEANAGITELEGLQRSAPAKEFVRHLNSGDIKERLNALFKQWEVSHCSTVLKCCTSIELHSCPGSACSLPSEHPNARGIRPGICTC